MGLKAYLDRPSLQSVVQSAIKREQERLVREAMEKIRVELTAFAIQFSIEFQASVDKPGSEMIVVLPVGDDVSGGKNVL